MVELVSTKRIKLEKLKRAIAKARISNPVDAAVAGTLPTITTAFDATLATFFQPQDSVAGTVPAFNLLGGNALDFGLVATGVHGYQVSATQSNTGAVSNQLVLEFDSDAPKIMVRGAQGTWRVEVNGQFLSKTGNATAAGGGEQQLVLDWSGVRSLRSYRFHPVSGGWFSRVGVDALSRVSRPRKERVRAVFAGDSYTSGTGATYGDSDWASIAAYLLGIDDPWHSALTGTGFLNPGTTWTARSHVSDITGASPDLVVIAYGTNDTGLSGIQAEVLLYLQTIRASLANVPIVVLGPWPKATGPSAAILTVESAVSAAVTQFNDPLCAFVPVSADTVGSWVFGTGFVGATNGSGNSDVYIDTDGIHPSNAGHEFLGRRAAAGIATALMAM
ncbi:SGNH/GDSL hydrolase family protein [Bradyrhizobium sp. STM 3561]|uniref:SGNH/GDSL hydrolase family protein n=1 Tax=Bradyrhizobium sp. STM 3561 TaxID=578923 RepID=UPI00388FF9A6